MCTEHAKTERVWGHVLRENVWNLDALRLLPKPFVEQNSSQTTNIHINMNIYIPAHCAMQQAIVLTF